MEAGKKMEEKGRKKKNKGIQKSRHQDKFLIK